MNKLRRPKQPIKINQQMLLCAIVGGSEIDLKHMKLVREECTKINCFHPTTLYSDVYFDCNDVPKISDNYVTVELMRTYFEQEKIGYVGKCTTCGQIYYREVETDE